MTDAYEVEVKRRTDKAYSLIPLAIRLMSRIDELSKEAAIKRESLVSKWLLAAFIIGTLMNIFIEDDGALSTVASLLTYGAIFIYIGNTIELAILNSRIKDWDYELEKVYSEWQAVAGFRTLYSIKDHL